MTSDQFSEFDLKTSREVGELKRYLEGLSNKIDLSLKYYERDYKYFDDGIKDVNKKVAEAEEKNSKRDQENCKRLDDQEKKYEKLIGIGIGINIMWVIVCTIISFLK